MLKKIFSRIDEVTEKIGFHSYKCKTPSRLVLLMPGSSLDKNKLLFLYMYDAIEKIGFPSYKCKMLFSLFFTDGHASL